MNVLERELCLIVNSGTVIDKSNVILHMVHNTELLPKNRCKFSATILSAPALALNVWPLR